MGQNWYLRRNRLRQLAAFCQTGLSGSMSAAAVHLRLSQPAVSLLVKELEEDLECSLFVRRGPRLLLRPAGRALLELALPLLRRAEQLPAELARRHLERGGQLCLAAGEPLRSGWLPPLLRGLAEARVEVEDAAELPEERLLAGDLDLYAGASCTAPPELRLLPLPPAALLLLLPAAHPLAGRASLTPEELAALDLVLPLHRHPPWECLRPLLAARGLRPRAAVRISGLAALQHCVAEGLGAAVVDRYCPDGGAATVGVPIRPAPDCTYGAWLPAAPPTPLLREFLRRAGLEQPAQPPRSPATIREGPTGAC